MIKFLSSWAKSIGLAIVLVSILEMILPNNNTKKYIKMVMGTYVLFCIISPFLQNKIDLNDLNLEEYVQSSSTVQVKQESMDKRINELYIEELEKNISKKVEEQGYKVNNCNVDATIADNVQDTKIDKITLDVEVNENAKQEDNVEDRIVSGIQKIKEVNTTVNIDNINSENKGNSKDTSKEKEKTKLTETQKKQLKKFLKEEYEVNEKCLVIT